MHGRKRDASAASAEQTSAVKRELEKYTLAVQLALKNTTALDANTLEHNATVLQENPDVQTLWNHRRRVILEDKSPDPSVMLTKELKLTAAAIAKNPKSYPAWHHRQWMIDHYGFPQSAPVGVSAASDGGQSSAAAAAGHVAARVDYRSELGLCGKLLTLDERNFHCWNYRRWIADRAGVPVEKELDYTLERIKINFSNYSAWHQRSALLKRQAIQCEVAASPDGQQQANPPVALSILQTELQLIRQAVFTEPDDQSPWFYRRWAVSEVCKHLHGTSGANAADATLTSEAGTSATAALQTLDEDASHLLELSEVEPECKWPLIALVQTLQCIHAETAEQGGGACVSLDSHPSLAAVNVAETLERLREMDPLHYNYYAYLLRKEDGAQ